MSPGPWLDLHVHSTCSSDGASSLADHARRALALGLSHAGFCEHADFDPRDEGYGTLDLDRYDRELAAARAAFPAVRLLQGVEISYQAGREAEIGGWLAGHAWDYVVASVHIVDYADGWAIVSEPRTASDYFAGRPARHVYAPYFEEMLRAARSGLGDVLGHLDIVKRYGTAHLGPFDPADFAKEIRAVLRAAVESGVGLEINTSGLRQAPRRTYPDLTVLRWYRELGGELVTVGSDAHHARDLAAGIAGALDMARAAGFSAIAAFEERRPRRIAL